MTEREKFELLLSILRFNGYKIKVIHRYIHQNKNRGQYNIEGDCYYTFKEITLKILHPDLMSEDDWSEASATLLHEFGHCSKAESSERKAWKNAKKWVEKDFGILKPRRFGEIMERNIEEYKNYMKEHPYLDFSFQY